MTIKVGDTLPEASMMKMGPNGPETIELAPLLKDRKVVIFAVPAAFSTTCHTAHVPSFLRVMDKLAEKGVDEVICIAVNDPFVMAEWAKATGAEEAGIRFLADPACTFTKEIGMNFTAPVAGLYDRSLRYALCAENGKITVLNQEVERGCEISGGETMVASL